MRKAYVPLRRGEYKRMYAEGEVLAYSRFYNNESVTVAFNASKEARTIDLVFEKKPQVLFGKPVIAGNQIAIPPRSGIILK
jgi:glycosidase